MNSHEQYAALLDAFIDGALTQAEAGRVRAHLATCAECQAYVTDALTMRELFPGVEETPVPDGFAETVLSGLPPQERRTQTRDDRRRTQARDDRRRTQARDDRRRTQTRDDRRRTRWMKIAVPLAACVTLALIVGGIWRGLPADRGVSGGAADIAADGAAVADMTQNATVTAADADEFMEESADMDEAAPESAPEFDEAPTGSASEFDEVTGSALEFNEVTAGSASDMDGGVAYNAKSAADGGAIGNDTDDAVNGSSASGASNATAQNGAARKRTYETPETEEIAPFDFGMTAPTVSDSAAPFSERIPLGESSSAETEPAPQSAETEPASQSAETEPAPQSAETEPAPRSAETEPAPRDMQDGLTQSDAAPVPEPLEPQRASGTADANAESAPAEAQAAPQGDAATIPPPVAVSYWTLSPDAAPRLEQYPVSKKTAFGAWYALNPEQFDALREDLTESAFTPMDVDSLSADDAPPIRDRAPVYVFLPFS